MSKKAQRAATPPPEEGATGGIPPRVDVASAMARLAPYIFTIDTDSRENVDLKALHVALSRDAALVGNLLVVDKVEVCQWFSTLTDPSIAPVVADVKNAIGTLADPSNPTAGDPSLIAQVVRHKILLFAAEREEQRLDEEEANMQRHNELVDRLIEDGLTKSEAEKQAHEEEEAALLNEDGSPIEIPRATAYVLLKGFPFTSEHVLLLSKQGIQLNSVFIMNCQAKFGRRDEPVVDPKAKKKAPETKKADAKKGKQVEAVSVPTESLATQIAKDLDRLPKFESHPLKEVHCWTYEIASAEGKFDEASSTQHYDLQESEADVADRTVQQVLNFELMAYEYRQWLLQKGMRAVAPVFTKSTSNEPPKQEEKKLVPAAEPKTAPPPKKGGKKEEPVAAPAAPTGIELPPAAPPLPPLPATVSDIPVDDELYRRLADEVAPGNLSHEVQMHCLLEQVQESCVSAACPDENTSSAVADSIASKTRRDVSDFCDFMLARLDGTQDAVFEAARKKRLKAAEAMQESTQNSTDRSVQPLASSDYFSLVPATASTIEPDSLLLGVPLYKVEGEVRRAVHNKVMSLFPRFIVRRTDLPGIKSIGDAHNILKLLLTQPHENGSMALTEGDATALLEQRKLVQVQSLDAFYDRFGEIALDDHTGTAVRVECEDGSAAICVSQRIPAEKKSWDSVWAQFHGSVPFPQWIAWREYAQKEDLFFNPPPRDDDEEVQLQEEAIEEEEEEEEEQDEPKGVDENNDDADAEEEKKPKKKKKERAKLEPEYIDNDALQTTELRRRSILDHVRRWLDDSKEELLLANNHTATECYVEESSLFPDDGCVINTSITAVNDKAVHCSVKAQGKSLFGFRLSIQPPPAPPLSEPQAVAVESQQQTTPRGTKPGAKQSSAPEPQQVQTPRGDPEPKPLEKVGCGVNALLSVGGDEAQFHFSATGFTKQDLVEEPTQPTGEGEEPESPKKRISTQKWTETSVFCTLDGRLAVAMDPQRGSVHFKFDTPRDCPVTVYNPLTAQIQRIFTAEVQRWVLPDGVVLSTFEDGTKMNMFPNGDTAVFHKNAWLITNSHGRRVLKQTSAEGTTTVTPLVLSLVTTNTDVDTMSKVTTREDGVVTVTYDDGRTLVQHIEGTRMWRDAAKTTVEVETEGLPLMIASTPAESADVPPLCLKTSKGLVVTLAPATRRISISHSPSSLSAVVDLKSHTLHVRPSETHSSRYAIDYALGGLRALVDDPQGSNTTSYHVTPFGRTKVRPADQDQPTEIVYDPEAKKRQIIEVFMALEVVNPSFVEAAGLVLGEDVLHRAASVPDPLTWGHNAASLAPPPRSRQLKDKERQTSTSLRSIVPSIAQGSVECPRSTTSPYLFVVLKNQGVVVEFSRKEDVQCLVNESLSSGNLLESDVFTEVVAPQEEDAPPPLERVIVSIAPRKPQVRPGIPKILLDLRSGGAGSSAPMGVPSFLQELKAGPGVSASRSQDIGEFGTPSPTACSTRNYLRFKESTKSLEWEHQTKQGEKLLASAGDPCFQRAVSRLAASIPPLIATQISAQRTAAIVGMKPHGAIRGGDGGSRSRNRHQRTSSSSGPKSAGAGDVEFQEQMQQRNEAERRQRKSWPTPINDRKEKIENLKKATSLNYWTTAGEEHIAELEKANEPFKAANGYQKEPVPHYLNPLASVLLAEENKPAEVEEKTTLSDDDDFVAPAQSEGQSQRPQKTPTLQSSTMKLKKPDYQQTTQSAKAQGVAIHEAKKAPRIVATPTELYFGKVEAGVRYSAALTLTNVGGSAGRFRIESSDSGVIVGPHKSTIAAGMNVRIEIELDGSHSPGSITATLVHRSESGPLFIPVIFTVVSEGRPLSSQAGIRVLGPAKLKYVPGSVRKSTSARLSQKEMDLDIGSDDDEKPVKQAKK